MIGIAINNESTCRRAGGVERDAGRDEKQLLKFAWPKEHAYVPPASIQSLNTHRDEVKQWN